MKTLIQIMGGMAVAVTAAVALTAAPAAMAADTTVYPSRATNLTAALSTNTLATAWLPKNLKRAGVRVHTTGDVWAGPIRYTVTVSGSTTTVTSNITGMNATNLATATGFLISSNSAVPGSIWIPVEQMGTDAYQLRGADPTNRPVVKTLEFSFTP